MERKEEEHKKSEKQISFQTVLTNCVTFLGSSRFSSIFLFAKLSTDKKNVVLKLRSHLGQKKL